MRKGKLVIFSAPSGSGKTSIVRKLLEIDTRFGFSISATTRPKRPNEVHGFDYYFLSKEEFTQKIENGDFAEFEEVYDGVFYGTLKSEIQRVWDLGKTVIFDVDVHGGSKLKKTYAEQALAIFVRVDSVNVLRERLTARNTESQESLEKRLSKAEYEFGFEHLFDVTIVNNHLDQAVAEAKKVVDEFLQIP